MRQFLFIAALALICSVQMLHAAKPVTELPPLESNAKLEEYEDSENLFAGKLLEIYYRAVVFETQIRMMGGEPKVTVQAPTLDQLTDLETSDLKKFYKIALTLKKQIDSMPETDLNSYRLQVNQLQRKISDTIAHYIAENGKVQNDVMDDMIRRMAEQDSVYREYSRKIAESYQNGCVDMRTIMSVAVSGNLFFSNGGETLKNDPSIGTTLRLNASSAVGFWRGFDFWFTYNSPRLFTESTPPNGTKIREQWNANLYATGLAGTIPIEKTKTFTHGVTISLGYFWANGKIYNKDAATFNWDGVNLNVEYYAGIPRCDFPVDFYAGLGLYSSFKDGLVLDAKTPGFDPQDYGKTHMTFYVGLRWNFWRSAL